MQPGALGPAADAECVVGAVDAVAAGVEIVHAAGAVAMVVDLVRIGAPASEPVGFAPRHHFVPSGLDVVSQPLVLRQRSFVRQVMAFGQRQVRSVVY